RHPGQGAFRCLVSPLFGFAVMRAVDRLPFAIFPRPTRTRQTADPVPPRAVWPADKLVKVDPLAALLATAVVVLAGVAGGEHWGAFASANSWERWRPRRQHPETFSKCRGGDLNPAQSISSVRSV